MEIHFSMIFWANGRKQLHMFPRLEDAEHWVKEHLMDFPDSQCGVVSVPVSVILEYMAELFKERRVG